MKLRKRAILIICVLAMLMVYPVQAHSFSDTAFTKYERAVDELEMLHIISGYEDGTFRPNNNLTRAEFCTLLIKTMGMDGITWNSEEINFSDVDASHWAFGYISAAYGMKIINGYDDGNFGPEDEVTYVQTLKMLLNAMGYAPMAEDNGGYPGGYIVTGVPLLSKGVSKGADESISRGEAAVMIYNALDVNIMEPEYGKTDAYKINYNKTLLSELMDSRGIESKTGVVTGNAYTRLTDSQGVNKEWLEIDGINYYIGDRSVYDLLGRYVKYYMQETPPAGKAPALYSIWPVAEKNKELVIELDNIANVDSGKITYYPKADSAKTRTVTLADNPITIFNGKYIPTDSEKWKVENGKITLLSNDGDTVYDIVFVDTYTTLMVDSVDTEKKQIGLRVYSDNGESRFKGNTCIEYGDPNTDVTITDSKGETLTPDKLRQYDVIAVYASEDGEYISIVRADGVIEGTVESVSEDTTVIDGKKYAIAKNNSGQLTLTLTPGEKGRFWLDIDGRVTAKNVVSGSEYSKVVETIDDEVICSYIIDSAVISGLDDVVKLKVLSNLKTKKREERILTLKNNLTVDGVRMSATEALEVLKETGDGTVNVPIRYDLNSRGEIDTIETFVLAGNVDYRKYSKSTNSFGGLYYLTADSIVYFVDNANYEKVYGNTEISLGDGLAYYVKAFDPSNMDFAAENRIYIVYVTMATAQAPSTDTEKPLLVESVVGFIKNDEKRFGVDGYMDGERVSLTLSEKINNKAERIDIGSLLRITKSGNGEIGDFKLLTTLPSDKEYRLGIGGDNEQLYGKAKSIKTNAQYTSVILEMEYMKNGSEQNVSYEISNSPIYIFDERRSTIEVGTINDISTTQYAEGNASDVFVYTVNFNTVAVVVVK